MIMITVIHFQTNVNEIKVLIRQFLANVCYSARLHAHVELPPVPIQAEAQRSGGLIDASVTHPKIIKPKLKDRLCPLTPGDGGELLFNTW